MDDVETLIHRIVEMRSGPKVKGAPLASRVGPLVEQVIAAGGRAEDIAAATGAAFATVEDWLKAGRRSVPTRPTGDIERTSRLARRAFRTDSARFDVECEQCHAAVGEACVGPGDKPLNLVHPARARHTGLTARFEEVADRLAGLEAKVASGRRDCPPVTVEQGVSIFVEDSEVRAEVVTSCGHASTLRDAGSDDETVVAVLRCREWVCPACRFADKNVLAAATAAVEGWPDLQGTPKQVAWANSIRVDRVAQLRDYVRRQGFAERWQALVVARMVDVTQAKWWIDGRDAEPFRVVLSTLLPADFAAEV